LKMKILHIIGSVDPRSGGPIEGITRQVAARNAFGVTTHIASLDRPDDPWVATSPAKTFALGIRSAVYAGLHHRVPWLRYRYTPHLVPWLRRHVRDYDVVVVNGLWNYSAFAARRALVRIGAPYVVFTHGMLDPWFRKSYPVKHLAKQLFWWFSEGPLLANASAVLFTTDDERDLARNEFWPYQVTEKVIGYGTADIKGDPEIQLAAFRAAVPALGGRRFLLFLSRIHPKKGCDLLVDAFARIAPDDPGIDLVIAGPDQIGWQKDLMSQALELQIADRIHWPGMLAGDAKWGAFRACDAFVLPSHSENFGIVVAEAMASEKPVLITNKVNLWKEVELCGGGLVADNSIESVHTMLKSFLRLSAGEVNEMGRRARAGFLKSFEINSFVRTQLDFFESLVSEARRNGKFVALSQDSPC
jgi:glycosyltransferase involved in cell wall biosynthesis